MNDGGAGGPLPPEWVPPGPPAACPPTAAATSSTAPPTAWATPSTRLRALRRAEVAAVTAAVGLVAAGIAAASGSASAVAVVVVASMSVGLVADGFAGRRVRAWRFAEREDDLLVRRGVLIQRLSVIPYGRMQFIDVTAGPLERLFGLATVKMHTAAAASHARIPGLPTAEAARLRDQLTTLGESQAAGL